MLSVAIISSHKIQQYYLQQDGGYSLEGVSDAQLYRWVGRGAERLGLVGKVDHDTHQRVFEGILSDTIRVGKRDQAGGFTGRHGYDLTFSMNKELSLMICCTKDKALREALLTAHDAAVNTVMREVERKVSARQTVGGQVSYVTTGNMIASLCMHFSSRAGDPQIHTHALVANATQLPNGQWRALATDLSRIHGFYEKARDNATFFGHMYQNEMQHAVEQLGFQTRSIKQHGMFEIVGFPDEMKAHFSKRRAQIEGIVTSLTTPEEQVEGSFRDWSNKQGLFQQVAQYSRPSKLRVKGIDFIAQSQARMAEWLTKQAVDKTQATVNRDVGSDPDKTTGDLASQKVASSSVGDFDELLTQNRQLVQETLVIPASDTTRILDAVELLGAFQVTFDANRVIEKAMSFPGASAFESLQSALEQEIEEGTLLMMSSGCITSRALIDREVTFTKQVKQTLKLSAATTARCVPSMVVSEEAIADGGIYAEKRQAVSSAWMQRIGLDRCLATSRLCILHEPASLFHKMTMLDSLITELTSSGKKVTLLTQTASFAMEYSRGKASRQALWQQLKHLNKPPAVEPLPGFLHRYQEQLNNPLSNLLARKGREVFLVDGSQQMSLTVAEQLIQLTQQRETRVVFLAFPQGRRSMLASDALQLLTQAGVPVLTATGSSKAALTTHKEHTAKTSKMHTRDPLAMGEKIEKNREAEKNEISDEGLWAEPRIVEVKLPLNTDNKHRQRERQQRIARDVAQYSRSSLRDTQLFSLTRRAAHSQACLLRDALKQQGTLGAQDHTIHTIRPVYLAQQESKHAVSFKVGWIARTYAGSGQFIEQTIIAIDSDNNRLTVRERKDRQRSLSPDKLLHQSTRLFAPGKLMVSHHDRLRLHSHNDHSRRLRLSLNTSYKLALRPNIALLIPIGLPGKSSKPHRLSHLQLNGLDIGYDYVKTVNELPTFYRHKRHAVVDAPLYALDKSLVQSMNRCYTTLTLYTDDQKKAEKRLRRVSHPLLASELMMMNYQSKLDLSQQTLEDLAQQALDYGLAVVSSREAAFSQEKLIATALTYNRRKVSVKSINTILDKLIASQTLSVRQTPKGDRWLATQEAIHLEKAIIGQIHEGKATLTPLMDHATLSPLLTDNSKAALTRGQRNACELIATTTDRFVMVQGYAGTGKSTMLTSLKAALSQASVLDSTPLIALAPTHKAVKELCDKGIAAKTLKQFLVDQVSLKALAHDDLSCQQPVLINPTLAASVEQPMTSPLDHALILLDEASMVSNSDFYQLQTLVSGANQCRCVYLGDIAQLTSVEAGKPCELSYIAKQADIRVAVMDEVLRQQVPELTAIAQDLMVGTPGHVERAFERLDTLDAIHEVQGAFYRYSHYVVSKTQLEQHYCAATDKAQNSQPAVGFYWCDDYKTQDVFTVLAVHPNVLPERLTLSMADLDDEERSALKALKWPDSQKRSDTLKVLVKTLVKRCKHNHFKALAWDYCNRSLAEQRDTLIGVATNHSRRCINAEIRYLLSEQGVLSGESLTVTQLIDSRLTDAELRYAANYERGNVVQLGQVYQRVMAVDKKRNTLVLEQEDGTQRPVHLAWLPEHTILACFRCNQLDIRSGDRLKWTKTDKERGLTAHESLQVRCVDPAVSVITVEDTDGKVFDIDLTLRHNQHIDYQYATTIYGLQGATDKIILLLLYSGDSLSNHLRLFYVALTRASHEVKIYTDYLKVVCNQIIHERGDQASALEMMDLLAIREHLPSSLLKIIEPLGVKVTHKVQKVSEKVPKAVSQVNNNKADYSSNPSSSTTSFKRFDKEAIDSGLRGQIFDLCYKLFGEPNSKLSNATQLRYGSKGSLSVTISGRYQGFFTNFETGEAGSPLTLLMKQLGTDFKGALEAGNNFLGGHLVLDNQQISQRGGGKKQSRHKPSTAELAAERRKADKANQQIQQQLRQSQPLSGTLAERYLKNRAISNTHCRDLRFIARVSTGKGNESYVKTAAALVAVVRNLEGKIMGMQYTYLCSNKARKLDLYVTKRSRGVMAGNALHLTPPMTSPRIAFVAEGIETGLSIRDALASVTHNRTGENTLTNLANTTQVLVSMGKSNFKNMTRATTATHLIFVADHDGTPWKSDRQIQSAITSVEASGKSVTCIQPPPLAGKGKTDYNDLAQVGRQLETVQQVQDVLMHHEEKRAQHEPIKPITVESSISAPSIPSIPSTQSTDRQRPVVDQERTD